MDDDQDAIGFGRALEPRTCCSTRSRWRRRISTHSSGSRDAVDIPIAAGERVSTIWGILPYIERELVDVIQPDTGRAGGITQMRKMAAMAEAHFITMAPHSGSLGPVAEFAALHVMATIPNASCSSGSSSTGRAARRSSPPRRKSWTAIAVPTAPGLGVDIVDEIGRYPSRRNVRVIAEDDGTAYAPGTAGENFYFQTRLRRRKTLRISR